MPGHVGVGRGGLRLGDRRAGGFELGVQGAGLGRGVRLRGLGRGDLLGARVGPRSAAADSASSAVRASAQSAPSSARRTTTARVRPADMGRG